MTAAAAAPAHPEPVSPPPISPDVISPDVNRVVQSLTHQLAEAIAELAMLRDVVQQYVARDVTAARAADPATEPAGDAPPA